MNAPTIDPGFIGYKIADQEEWRDLIANYVGAVPRLAESCRDNIHYKRLQSLLNEAMEGEAHQEIFEAREDANKIVYTVRYLSRGLRKRIAFEWMLLERFLPYSARMDVLVEPLALMIEELPIKFVSLKETKGSGLRESPDVPGKVEG